MSIKVNILDALFYCFTMENVKLIGASLLKKWIRLIVERERKRKRESWSGGETRVLYQRLDRQTPDTTNPTQTNSRHN